MNSLRHNSNSCKSAIPPRAGYAESTSPADGGEGVLIKALEVRGDEVRLGSVVRRSGQEFIMAVSRPPAPEPEQAHNGGDVAPYPGEQHMTNSLAEDERHRHWITATRRGAASPPPPSPLTIPRRTNCCLEREGRSLLPNASVGPGPGLPP